MEVFYLVVPYNTFTTAVGRVTAMAYTHKESILPECWKECVAFVV